MRSATWAQEKRNASDDPATPSTMAIKPEPVKPNQRTLIGPANAPTIPPL